MLTPGHMNPFGTSITFASPFLFLAVWGRWKRSLVLTAWLSIGLMLLFQLSLYTNGRIQVNTQRYMLDYLPILILLVALAGKRIRPGILEGLTLYAIGLNLIALFLVPWSK
jgi:hypothetical protein